MKLRRPAIIALLTLVSVPAAAAESCPAPLAEATRLVLVTAPSMNSARVTLRRYQRGAPNTPWQPLGAAEPAVIGRAGMAWGHTFRSFKRNSEPEKVEGDRRAPAGVFRIGVSFGFRPSPRPGHIVLKPGETICVDDPSSPVYNTITTRSAVGPKVRAEHMGNIDLYRRGLFIDYPSDRERHAGSCIYIHVWRGPGYGTAGCVALPETRVIAMQEFAEPGAVLAILPQHALDRFGDCLPK